MMMKSIQKIPLLLITSVITLSANAAERLVLTTTSLQQLQQQIPLDIPGITNLSLHSSSRLRLLKQHTDANQITHIRLQQEYAGFPVMGGYVILHSSMPAQQLAAAKTIKLTGAIYQQLSPDLGQPPANFVSHSQHVLQQFTAQFDPSDIHDATVTPLIYIDQHQKAHWAYKVSALLQSDHHQPERPSAIIDATHQTVFIQWNDLKTSLSIVKGIGYGGNARIGQYQFGDHYSWLNMTREAFFQRCYLENKNVRVVDMDHRYSKTNLPVAFYCGSDSQYAANIYWTGYDHNGLDSINGAYSPANDALYLGELIKTMYHDWYGVNVLTQGAQPMRLVMRVHYGKNYANAFWDGQQMTFGDGDDELFPLVTLTVSAHEVSHGFTEQHANLDYFGQSGGINEAFSDMAAQAAEFYVHGTNDWLIGADTLREEAGKALRYMDKPSQDGISIDSADQYHDKLDVHFSSGVYNHLFYLLATQPHWDTKQAFQVMLKANMDYWTPSTTFAEGACGIIHAAQDLHLPIDAVKQACDGVAIDYSTCG